MVLFENNLPCNNHDLSHTFIIINEAYLSKSEEGSLELNNNSFQFCNVNSAFCKDLDQIL